MREVKLSAYGKMTEEGFDWKGAVADAAIIAGLTFFTTLGSAMSQGVPANEAIVIAGVAAAVQFFTLLAIKRGLIK